MHFSTISNLDSSLINELQYVLDSVRIEQDVEGASVSINFGDSGDWLGVSGESHPDSPIRTDHLFSIASITKTFTAAAILQLAEEEALALDDSLYRWLPPFEWIDSTITIRQLLNHTSGVFSFHESGAFWDSIYTDHERFWTPEEMIRYFVDYPYFEPSEGWHYSNTNYLLLGMIIREATESEVSTEFRERFLDPLELNNSYLDIEEEYEGEIAHGWHDIDSDGDRDDIFQFPRTSWYSAIWTGGAMVSTPDDISRWARALYGI